MRVFIFFDYRNFRQQLEKNNIESVDYKGLIDYLANDEENRYLINGYFYTTESNDFNLDDENSIDTFKSLGFNIHMHKTDNEATNKIFDSEITYDILNVTNLMKPDIIILVSDNQNFEYMIRNIKNLGIRVETVGFYQNYLSKISSSFIDLKEIMEPSGNETKDREEEVEPKEESKKNEKKDTQVIENKKQKVENK